MKRIVLVVMAVLFGFALQAQKMMTRTGQASFFSKAPLEDIAAINKQVTILINTSSGAIAVKVPIRSFRFDKALMEEHFNENYLESDKFPEATFTGNIVESTMVSYDVPGNYEVMVKGKITIHGVTKDISEKATLTVTKDGLNVNCTFHVNLSDFNIKNDKKDNIANKIEVKVSGHLSEL